MIAAAADSVSPDQAVAARFGMRRNPFAGEASSPDFTDGESLSRLVDDVRDTLLEGHLLTVVTGASRARQTEFADRLAKTFGEEIRFLSLHGNKLSFASAATRTRAAAPARLHQSIDSIEFVVESAIRQAAHIERAGLLIDHADGLDAESLLVLLDFVERFRSQRPPVQLVLIGTESTLQTLTDAACARFGDLAARHFSLDRLSRVEARGLVARRLQQAGGKRELFPDASVDVAHELTNGYADTLMGLSMWAMWLAGERGERVLKPALVREAATSALRRAPPPVQAVEPADAGSFEVFQPGKLTAFDRPKAEPLRLPASSGRAGERRRVRLPYKRKAAPEGETPATLQLRFDMKWLAAAAAALLVAVAIGWGVWRGQPSDGEAEVVVADASPDPDTRPAPVEPEAPPDEPAFEELPAIDPALVETPAYVDIQSGEVSRDSGETVAEAAPAAPDESVEATPASAAAGTDAVATLLETARRQFEQQKLTTPAGDNARETYRQALEREPSNSVAREGLERIRATYLQWADSAQRRQDWSDAEVYLRRALALSPDDASVAQALERLQARQRTVTVPPPAAVVDDSEQDAALLQAAREGDVVAIAEAAESGAALDARDDRGKTSLMWAAEQGSARAARQLEARGADVDLATDTGDTALMYAAQAGHADIVRFLINNGADVDRSNNLGWTALMYAAVGGYESAVRELLAQGADVNALTQDGKVPLMAAARNGHAAVVSGLIDAGARVDQMDRSGWTALMYAAWQGHTSVTEALLADDASLDIRNSEGQTALTLGIVRRNREIIDRLVQAGARR
ncbi:MAG: ankyrin repeat domain-containing protein [Gammaproteobacteria bacterium]